MANAERDAYIGHFQQVELLHGLLDHGDGFFAKQQGRVREQLRHPSQRDALMPLEEYLLVNGAKAWGYQNYVPRRFLKGFKCPHKGCGATNEVRFH